MAEQGDAPWFPVGIYDPDGTPPAPPPGFEGVDVWHIHALKHLETGAYDKLMSRSETPVLPAGFRRIDPATEPAEYWSALLGS